MLKRLLVVMNIFIEILALGPKASSIEAVEKQTKLDACFKILKHRTINDFLYFERLVYLFNSLGGESDKTQKVLFMTLCSCYNEIPFYLAEQIVKQTTLNMTQNDIKALSKFEMWEEAMTSKNQARIGKELKRINSAFDDIKMFDLDISRLQSDFTNQNRIIRNIIDDKLNFGVNFNLSTLLIGITVIIAICLVCFIINKHRNKLNSKCKTN